MIYETPILSGKVLSKLERLHGLRSKMSKRLGLAMPWDKPLRRSVKGDSYGSSTEIEGYNVALFRRAILASDDGGASPQNEDEEALVCYAQAMEHVTALAADPEFTWNTSTIRDLHFEACRFQKDKHPGLYRTDSIRVTGPGGVDAFVGPDFEVVAGLVTELAVSLEDQVDSVDPAVLGAMAHLNLVSIHPFEDGNGRISRIIQSLVLARGGSLAPEFGSIEPYLAAHTDDYYAALGQAQKGTYSPDRNAAKWVEFCLDAHIRQANDRLELIDESARRWDRISELAADRGWDERLLIALEQALAGSTDRASYAAEAGISNATATTDLRRLLDAGMVDQSGSGPSTSYMPTERLRRLVTPDLRSR